MNRAVVWTLSGVAAVGLVGTGVASWALMQPSAPAGSSDDTPAEGIVVDAAEVPALYTGDELEWLIPPDDVLAGLVGASGFEGIQASYSNVGESEGLNTTPTECAGLILEDLSGVVGSRWERFSVDGGSGSVRVLQFGSPENAEAWSSALELDGACSSFQQLYGDEPYADYTYEVLAESAGDLARVQVSRLDQDQTGEWDYDSIEARMVHGNVVVMVTVGYQQTVDIDADALAAALLQQSDDAHATLARQLR
jgi:hypothetical protein